MAWLGSFFGRKPLAPSTAPISFFNTLSEHTERFVPLKSGLVLMYSCGPTVYKKQHIGNLKASLFADLIARVLIEAGYHVRRVINITDVGHLIGDGDHGEDKIEKSAREERKKPEEIAGYYTDLFLSDLRSLNVDIADILFPHATDYIREQIGMVKLLEERGFAYRAEDGVYFDTKKFPNYGQLGHVNEAKLLPGARVEKISGKRSAHDFVLWRFAKPKDLQQWDSPWGHGNPGWHIECSAMIRSLLGPEIDIHTGGIDHIPVHHNNEIAQSESLNGRPLARFWMHEAFVTVNEEKISKSFENDIYLSDIIAKGYPPLALRYFFLQVSYRTPVLFTWDSLHASAGALKRLWALCVELKSESRGTAYDSDAREKFIVSIRDDLKTPAALALLWESLRGEELSPEEKWGLILSADAFLGLELANPPLNELTSQPLAFPPEIQQLVYERDLARAAKNWAQADTLRYQLEERGYRVEDSANGTLLSKSSR